MVFLNEEIYEDDFADFVAAMEAESQQKFNSFELESVEFESVFFSEDGYF